MALLSPRLHWLTHDGEATRAGLFDHVDGRPLGPDRGRRPGTWHEFPSLWRRLLDEVYAFLKTGTVTQDGQNIMLYRDDVPNVEVGVQVSGTFEAAGRVTPSSLPGGSAAMTVHRGSYDGLGDAHRAVLAWCHTQGHEPTGVRWEIYGDWHDNPDKLETEVWYQLR